MNLAKGGSLENAVVVKDSKILRDYYKYCKTGSLNNAYYLKLIKQNTKELPILRKNKTFEKNYQKI